MTLFLLRPSKGRTPKYPWVIEERRNVVIHADRTTFTNGRRWYFAARATAGRKLNELSKGAK